MPVFAYFVGVGGVLLALLFVVDAYLPQTVSIARPEFDRSRIRVESDRAWPKPIIIDTAQPTITAPETDIVLAPTETQQVRQALAYASPSISEKAFVAPKRRVNKRQHRSRAVAVRREPPVAYYSAW
jgi:hypothetical protein